tara:strand:+ start:66935 stop:67309 length:375 start_codon:yes stop_codon:yes gene_type:complete
MALENIHMDGNYLKITANEPVTNQDIGSIASTVNTELSDVALDYFFSSSPNKQGKGIFAGHGKTAGIFQHEGEKMGRTLYLINVSPADTEEGFKQEITFEACDSPKKDQVYRALSTYAFEQFSK